MIIFVIKLVKLCILYFHVYSNFSTMLMVNVHYALQQYGDWYTGINGWAVTFGTARRGLGAQQTTTA